VKREGEENAPEVLLAQRDDERGRVEALRSGDRRMKQRRMSSSRRPLYLSLKHSLIYLFLPYITVQLPGIFSPYFCNFIASFHLDFRLFELQFRRASLRLAPPPSSVSD
jgi:hypothetical protein